MFALPMARLAGIQQLGETADQHAGPPQVPGSQARVAPTDLGALFYGEASADPNGFIVIVRADRHMYVLRVDRVRAGTNMPDEERLDLPPLIAALDGPFDGIFRDADGWGLIIDANRLAGLIGRETVGQNVEYLYELP